MIQLMTPSSVFISPKNDPDATLMAVDRRPLNILLEREGCVGIYLDSGDDVGVLLDRVNRESLRSGGSFWWDHYDLAQPQTRDQVISLLMRVGFKPGVLDALKPDKFRVPIDDHPFLYAGIMARHGEVRPTLFLSNGVSTEIIGRLVPNNTGGFRFKHTHLGACWLGLKLGAAYLAPADNREALKKALRALGFQSEVIDCYKVRGRTRG